jgi:uncharacterized protein with GYD domain
MAAYIMLVSWTQDGVKNIKKSPDRLAAGKKAFQSFGGEMKEF